MALGSPQAGIQTDRNPGIKIKFAVTIVNTRKEVSARFLTMRVKVMAKATLVQLVAMVVRDVDVFWKRKNFR